MFENHPKSRILKHCSLWKPEACGQTVLPDRSLLIGQKLAKNAKTEALSLTVFQDRSTRVGQKMMEITKIQK